MLRHLRLSPASRRARALWFMLGTGLCFSVLETVAKYLSQHYPVSQVVWTRYAVHTALMLVLVGPRRGHGIWRTPNPGSQLLRAALLMGSTLCNFGALSMLPLAEVKAISFVSPLLVTLFAVWLLAERVTPLAWLAVGTGFCGTLFIIRPGGAMFSMAAWLAVGNAVFYSLYQVMTRRMSEAEDPLVTLFYTALVGFAVLSVVAPWHAVAPQAVHLPLFLLLGCAGAGGHFLLIRALELESASALSPFSYTQLLWVLLWGALFFHQAPDLHAVLGMAIIVGSGLVVALGGRVRAPARGRTTP